MEFLSSGGVLGGVDIGRVEDAVSSFREGYTCSQEIVFTYAPEVGLDKETALRLSCPFGGGIGRRVETCGALMGAFMIIGLKFAPIDPEMRRIKKSHLKLLIMLLMSLPLVRAARCVESFWEWI